MPFARSSSRPFSNFAIAEAKESKQGVVAIRGNYRPRPQMNVALKLASMKHSASCSRRAADLGVVKWARKASAKATGVLTGIDPGERYHVQGRAVARASLLVPPEHSIT